MKKIFISLTGLVALVTPVAVLAQSPDFNYANDWIIQLIRVSQQAVTFLMVIATLWFIWTVIAYIRVKEAKDAEEKKKAMLRGIIGLVVIVGIWGIVSIVARTFGISGGSLPVQDTPCPPGMRYDTINRVCN